jgi:hypothetical protein
VPLRDLAQEPRIGSTVGVLFGGLSAMAYPANVGILKVTRWRRGGSPSPPALSWWCSA